MNGSLFDEAEVFRNERILLTSNLVEKKAVPTVAFTTKTHTLKYADVTELFHSIFMSLFVRPPLRLDSQEWHPSIAKECQT